MGRKVLLILPTVTHFGNIPLCSQRICYTSNSLRLSLHVVRYIIISFAAVYCHHIQISGSPTLLTASNRPTTLCQSALQSAHSLPYISVPDTRTNFNFCCSLNYKRNHFIVNHQLALSSDELLGSSLDR